MNVLNLGMTFVAEDGNKDEHDEHAEDRNENAEERDNFRDFRLNKFVRWKLYRK